MTLDTKVVISAETPVPVKDLYEFCRELVNTPKDVEPKTGISYSGWEQFANPPGIGADAWLIVNYNPDGPMYREPKDDWDEDDREWAAKDPAQNGWACIEISFDTAYGYSTDGLTCTQLHAGYIIQLAAWLTERGARFQWQNEYTGDWSEGLQADAFAEFLGAGDNAMDWFQNVAAPAIAASIRAGV